MIDIGGKQFDLDQDGVIQDILLWAQPHDRTIVIGGKIYSLKVEFCNVGGYMEEAIYVHHHRTKEYIVNAFDPIPISEEHHYIIRMALKGIEHQGELYRVERVLRDGGKTFTFDKSVFAQIPWRLDEDGYIVVTREEDVMQVSMSL